MRYLIEEFKRYRASGQPYPEFNPLKVATFESFVVQMEDYFGNLKGLRLLEIGAGSGIASVILAQRGAIIATIDKLSESLAFQRMLAAEFNVELQIIRGDAFRLPFPNGEFDLVFSFGMIEHYSAASRSLLIQEATRVSKSHLLVGTPNVLAGSAFDLFSRNSSDFDKTETHYRIKPTDYRTRFATCKFDGVSLFLTQTEFGRSKANLYRLHRKLSSRLPANRYHANDIKELVTWERSVDPKHRYRYAFLHYVLGSVNGDSRAERQPPAPLQPSLAPSTK